MGHLNEWLKYRRKILLEDERSIDDDIYEFKVKIRVPKNTTAQGLSPETASRTNIMGIESLKNDIRGLRDVTVVRTEDSESSADSLTLIAVIKINVRLIPSSESPEHYIKKNIIPELADLFNKGGNFPPLSRPRIVAISRAVDHFPVKHKG
jgi:hypothetical protein